MLWLIKAFVRIENILARINSSNKNKSPLNFTCWVWCDQLSFILSDHFNALDFTLLRLSGLNLVVDIRVLKLEKVCIQVKSVKR